MSDCFVYVIAQQCADPRQDKVSCKIGISSNPQARLTQIQTSCPFKLYLQAAYKLPSRWFAYRVEQQFHKTNWPWVTSGEWVTAKPFYAAEELAGYCIENWIADGQGIFDIAALCDVAGIPCAAFAFGISEFLSGATLIAEEAKSLGEP